MLFLVSEAREASVEGSACMMSQAAGWPDLLQSEGANRAARQASEQDRPLQQALHPSFKRTCMVQGKGLRWTTGKMAYLESLSRMLLRLRAGWIISLVC